MTSKQRRIVKFCVPCLSFTMGVVAMLFTADALAIPPIEVGRATISPEAWLGLVATGVFFVLGGFTARNDRDIRDLRKAIQEAEAYAENKAKDLVAEREVKLSALTEAFSKQFQAVTIEQRQQQAQINMLSERVLREHPRKEDLDQMQDRMDRRFDKLESMVQRSNRQ